MHFPNHLRLRRKAKVDDEPGSEIKISAPMSQPFDYGSTGVPPWMNDYATHLTEPVQLPHAARKNEVYHTKHHYIAPIHTSSNDWSSTSSRSNSSVRLTSPPHDPNLPPPLLQIPVGDKDFFGAESMEIVDEEDRSKERRKKKWNPFGRNKGLDMRGQLSEEWEEIYDADWGCPDEYSRNRKRWYD